MSDSYTSEGDRIVKCRDQLKAQYTPLTNHIRELSNLYAPFEINGDAITVYPWTDSMMFDSTPRQAASICANGLSSLVAPRTEEWFEWAPPFGMNDDEATSWFRECSAIARQVLDVSNFYEEFHGSVRDFTIYGTGNLFCGDIDERGELYYKAIPIGSYYFAENARGRPSEVYRDLKYTAQQAADEFGKDNLPEEVAAKLTDPKGKTELHDFVHAVFRRTDHPDKSLPPNQRGMFKSVVVHEKSKKIVKEETFHEFPFGIGRYERWQGCVWGFGPGAIAKGDSRQLNFLNELADVATEKSVFPPIEAPASMEGEIGLGALEINYRQEGEGPQIHEIGSQPRFDVAFQRLQDKREQVNKAFFVDLFTMFAMQAQAPGEITAYQASQMAGEKLTQFSPIFGRLVSEMLDVILDRLFGVLFRAGMFPPPPSSVLQSENGGIIAPAKRYKNRIVLAMQAKQNNAIFEYLSVGQAIAAMAPDSVLDTFDFTIANRLMARNFGVPEAIILPERETKRRQQQRAEQAAAQAELQAAEQASSAVKNFAQAGPKASTAAAGLLG